MPRKGRDKVQITLTVEYTTSDLLEYMSTPKALSETEAALLDSGILAQWERITSIKCERIEEEK